MNPLTPMSLDASGTTATPLAATLGTNTPPLSASAAQQPSSSTTHPIPLSGISRQFTPNTSPAPSPKFFQSPPPKAKAWSPSSSPTDSPRYVDMSDIPFDENQPLELPEHPIIEFRPHNPPVPTKGFIEGVRERFKSFWTFEHKLDPKSMGAVQNLTSTIRDAPSNAVAAMKGSISEVWHGISDQPGSKTFRDILEVILDIIPLALSRDSASYAAISAGILYRRGFLKGTIITGLTLLVKQFLKRYEWVAAVEPEVVHQAGEEEFDPSLDEEAAVSLYSLLYMYTIGSLPTVTPREVVSVLKSINLVGGAFRHIEYFGSWMIAAIRKMVNYIFHLTTGTYLFDSKQLEITEKWMHVAIQARNSREAGRLSPDSIRATMNAMEQIITEGHENSLPRELLVDWRRSADQFTAYSRVALPDVMHSHNIPPAVCTMILGKAGIGKTIQRELVARMLVASQGVSPDDWGQCVYTFQPGMNFPLPLPTRPIVCFIDDPLLIKDEKTRLEYEHFFAAVGSGKPFCIDAPFGRKGLEIPSFRFLIIWNNRPDLHEESNFLDAQLRRYNGGVWLSELTDFGDSKGQFKLSDFLRAQTHNPNAFDKAWSFTYGDKSKAWTLTQLVNAIIARADKLAADSHTFDAALRSIGGSFVRSSGAPQAIPIPTRLDYTKFQEHADAHVVRRARQPMVEHQVLVGDSHREVLLSAGVGAATADRIITYLRVHKKEVKVLSHGFTIDGEPTSVNELLKMCKINEVAPAVSLEVPLDKFTHIHMHAGEKERFHITPFNARWGAYDYLSEGESITDAFDAHAREVGRHEFAQWAMGHSDNPVFAHFAMIPGSSVEYAYPTLYNLVKMLAAGALVGVVLNIVATTFASFYSAYYTYKPEHQSGYGQRVAQRTKRGGLVRRLHGEPVHQSDLKPEDWLLRKLDNNILSGRLYKKSTNSFTSFFVSGVIGNLAKIPKHALEDSKEKLYISGPLAGVWPYRIIHSWPKEKINKEMLILPDPNGDVAWVIFPQNVPFFSDITKYMMSENDPVTGMTSMSLALREHYKFDFLDKDGNSVPFPTDRLAPQTLVPLVPFPLGDARDLSEYHAKGSVLPEVGLYIHSALPTHPGWCTAPVICNNPKFGGGYRMLVGDHSAYERETKFAIAQLIPQEGVRDILAMTPAVLHMDTQHLKPEHQAAVFNLSDCPYTGAVSSRPLCKLAPQVAPNLPRQNSIRPSPIYGALIGQTYVHPATGVTETISETQYVPARTWDIDPGLAKLRFDTHSIPPEVLDIHHASAERVYANFKANAAPQFLVPRTELLSLDTVLNGDESILLSRIDPKKSIGFGMRVTRQDCLYTKEDGRLDLIDRYKDMYHEELDKIKRGVFDIPLYQVSPKEELRKIGKATRVTSCLPFIKMLAYRTVGGLLPGLVMSGRTHNGTIFGCNLNSREGAMVAARFERYKAVIGADAVTYDASESMQFSAPLEYEEAKIIQMQYPFLSWEACMIVPLAARFGYTAVGPWVFSTFTGLQSGHIFTTPRNCGGTLAILDGAHELHTETSILDEGFATSYGDDCTAGTVHEEFTNRQYYDYGAALGITLTAPMKDGSYVDHIPHNEIVTLKTYLRRTQFNRVHAMLEPVVVAHISDYVHAKDFNVKQAATVNADAALCEWFHYGRETFDRMKTVLDGALATAGCSLTRLSYAQLFTTWYNNHGGGVIHRPEKQSSTEFYGLTSDKGVTGEKEPNPSAFSPADPHEGVTSRTQLSTHTDSTALVQYRLTDPAAFNLRNPLNPYPPTQLSTMLTREYLVASFQWKAADPIGTTYPEMVFPDLLMVPNNYSKLLGFAFSRAGVRLRACSNGQPYSTGYLGFAFIPNSVGVTQDWRCRADLLPDAPGFYISGNSPASVSYDLEYASARLWHENVDNPANNSNGIVIPYVMAQQRWLSASAPTFLQVDVYASFLQPSQSGYDNSATPTGLRSLRPTSVSSHNPVKQSSFEMLNDHTWHRRQSTAERNGETLPKPNYLGARACRDMPASEMLRMRLAEEWCVEVLPSGFHRRVTTAELTAAFAMLRLRERPVLVLNPAGLLRPGVRRLVPTSTSSHRPEWQSAQGEAESKAESGALTGVTSAVKTVSSLVEEFSPLLSLVGFDKPTTVGRTISTIPNSSPDMVSVQGEFSSTVLAAPLSAYIATSARTTCEVSPQPTWREVLRRPSLIQRFVIQTTDVRNAVLLEFPVDPTLSRDSTLPGFICPGMTAWYTAMHQFWHGSIDYLFVFPSSPLQKCQVKMSHFPLVANTGLPVPDNESGDVSSQTVDIAGDKIVSLRALFDRASVDLVTRTPFTPAGYNTANGRIQVQLTQGLSSQSTASTTAVECLVYMMAGPDFVLKGYRGMDTTLQVAFGPITGLRKMTPTSTSKYRPEKQACIQAMAGLPFTPFSPGKMLYAKGLTADDVTSGPTELARRFFRTWEAPDTNDFETPFNIPDTLVSTPDLRNLLIPWIGYAGSLNHRLYANTNWANTDHMVVWRNPDMPSMMANRSSAGMILTPISVSSTVAVTRPFAHVDLWYNTNDDLGSSRSDLPISVTALPDTTPRNVIVFTAFGDDLTVYHACTPPYLTQAPVPPDPEETPAQPEKTVSRPVLSAAARTASFLERAAPLL